MPDPAVTPLQLASPLAARLIHDVVGPAGGIVSAFEAIADPRAAPMRGEMLALVETTARKLVDRLAVLRTIYSDSGPMPEGPLRASAGILFAESRGALDLRIVGHTVSSISARLLLGLLDIAAMAVAAGGEVTATVNRSEQVETVTIRATGPRLRVVDDVIGGLRGSGPPAGQSHRWSMAYYLWSLTRTIEGELDVSSTPSELVLVARLNPAGD